MNRGYVKNGCVNEQLYIYGFCVGCLFEEFWMKQVIVDIVSLLLFVDEGVEKLLENFVKKFIFRQVLVINLWDGMVVSV